ncbi:hypothetical protein RJI07_04480 [Mycoplasmatota bacterium WC30]
MNKIYLLVGIASVIFNLKIIPSIPQDSHVKYMGEYQFDEYILQYGDIKQSSKDCDGLIIITNIESKDEIIVIYDDYGYETIRYVSDIGNEEFIGVCDEYYYSENSKLPIYKYTTLIKYNILGEEVEKLVLNYKPVSYDNHHNYLILTDKDNKVHYFDSDFNEFSNIDIEEEWVGVHKVQYQGELYVNGELSLDSDLVYPGYYHIEIKNGEYSFEYSITIHPKVIIDGIQYEEFYTNNIHVYSAGDIYINGDSYTSGQEINDPGNYTIKILGINDYIYEESFVIIPVITYFDGNNTYDFIDNLEITSEITIFSNGTSMLVNQETYNSTIISNPGEYQLVVSGINDLQVILNFHIYPTVKGLTEKTIYDSVTLSVFGEGILNGQTVGGVVIVDTPGEYRLDLIYEDDIYKTFEFTIHNIDPEKLETNDISKIFTYVFILLIVIGGYFILRKK